MLKLEISEVTVLQLRFSYYFELVFDAKHISGFKNGQGKFLIKKFAEEIFLNGSKIEKTPIWAQRLLVFLAILTVKIQIKSLVN